MTLTLVARAQENAGRTAIVAPEGTFCYGELLAASARFAFLVPPGFAYVAVQWGIWRAGDVAAVGRSICHVMHGAWPLWRALRDKRLLFGPAGPGNPFICPCLSRNARFGAVRPCKR
jgi:hypothetical protein